MVATVVCGGWRVLALPRGSSSGEGLFGPETSPLKPAEGWDELGGGLAIN